MRFQEPLLSSLLAVLSLPLASPAVAQTTQSPPPAAPASAMAEHIPHAKSLIVVSNCDPKLNYQQYAGTYVAGPWRGGYWADPYGARYYQPPTSTTQPELAIHYKNITHKTMSAIEFGLVANGRLVAEVRDEGTFSPNAEIKHRFGISANVFPIPTGLPQCVPLRVTFADGTKWRNPGLPPKNEHIYSHP